tara:strand:- start:158 stop:484 length:327 start_codon:yes stop_codon:yes gene_type:complete
MRDLSNEIHTYPQEKQNIYQKIMNCEKTDDFKKLAIYLGAELRDKNHIFIKHFNGDVTSIACTPKKKITLHKTANEFINIYIHNISNFKNEQRRNTKNNRKNSKKKNK